MEDDLNTPILEDLPIQQEAVIVDTPLFNTNFTAFNRGLDNFKASQAAMMDSVNTGRQFKDTIIDNINVINKDDALIQRAADKALLDSSALTEAFVEMNEGRDVGVQDVELVADLKRKSIEKGQQVDRQFVETIASDPTDEPLMEQITAKVQLKKLLDEAIGEVSGGDIALELSAAFVPFLLTVEDTNLTGTLFGQDEVMRRAITAFQLKTPEEKLKLFPALKEELIDKLGTAKGVSTLQAFFSDDIEESVEAFGDSNKIFDVLDIGGVVTGFAGAVKSFRNARNLIKTTEEVKNTKLAGELNAAALTDDTLSEALGVNKQTATSNGLPFDVSLADEAYTRGLSKETVDALGESFAKQDEIAQRIINNDLVLKQGLLQTKERAEKEAQAMASLEAQGFEVLGVESRTGLDTTFSFGLRDDETGELIKDTETVTYTLNDVGVYEQSETTLVKEFLSSNTVFAKGNLRTDVDAAQLADFATSRTAAQLIKLQNDAIKPLGNLTFNPKSRKSLAKVNDVLVQGDEFKNIDGTRGTVFDIDTLRGVYSLNDDEISSYYRLNRLYNNLFIINNNTARNQQKLLGFKSIELSEGERTFGKPFETSNDASNSINQTKITRVVDGTTGEVLDVSTLTKEKLDEFYAEGKVIVKSESLIKNIDDKPAFYALVDSGAVKELPQIVLNRKAGYVPKIYPDGAFFVKQILDVASDGGISLTNKRTLRFFKTKVEADKFRNSEIAKIAAREDISIKEAGQKIVTLADREEETINSAFGSIKHGAGGLYTGARAEDDILFGIEGKKARRLNAFESLSRNIGAVAKSSSINEWRLGIEQRWTNSVNKWLESKGFNERVKGFGNLPESVVKTKEGQFFLKTQEVIKDWLSFPSRDEQIFNSVFQDIQEWAVRGNPSFVGKGIGKVAGALKSKDPIAVSKSLTFHSMLGWGNFSQLWVQAQGANIALSLRLGKDSSTVLKDAIALTRMGDISDDGFRAKRASQLSKGNAEDLANLHSMWIKTGYADSVLQTADFAAALKGHGITVSAIKDAANLGLFPFKQGELFSRRIAFRTAVSRFMEKKGIDSIKDIKGDDALTAIMTDTNNLLLNMSKANRANFQKGLMSIPTQFLQVTAKGIETMTGANENFKGAELGRIIAGQLALYGAAGVPLVGLPVMYLTQVLGVTQEDIQNNPLKVEAFNNGFWGVMSHWVLGADMELSSRGSLIRGATDFTDRILFDESTVGEKILGAFGTTQNRFFTGISERLSPMMTGRVEVTAKNLAELATMPFLESISSFNNIKKAVVMNRLNEIHSRNGSKLIQRDFSLSEEFMQAIGFTPSDVAQVFDIEELMKAEGDVDKTLLDEYIKLLNSYALRDETGTLTDSFKEDFQKQKEGILMLIQTDPTADARFKRGVKQRLLGDTRQQMSLNRYLQRHNTQVVEELGGIRSLLLGNELIRITKNEEDN